MKHISPATRHSFVRLANFTISKTHSNKSILTICLVTLLSLTSLGSVSLAATFTVTKTADTNDGVCDSDCSFREAISAANNAQTSDIIEFDRTVFVGPQIITLTAGEIFVTNVGGLTVKGPGPAALTITSNLQSRIFNMDLPTNHQFGVTLNGLTLAAGSTADTGGCIFKDSGTLTINSSVIRDCTAGAGGAVFNSLGTLIVNDSTISGNSSGGGGGGIAGGGTGTNLIINNSTISGNRALGQGGGIENLVETTASFTNVTIAFNTSGEQGGGVYNFFNGVTSNFHNCIIAQNSSTGSGPDFSGTITSQGYNLIGNISGATVVGNTIGNKVGLNPMLAPLKDNGGGMPTHALLSGSPAMDAGDPVVVFQNDQRGVPVPLDGDANGMANPDMGSLEAGAKLVTKTADTNDGSCDDDCSLREAIVSANNSQAADAILFSGAFLIAPQTISLNGSQLEIQDIGGLYLIGPGSNLLTISGNNLSRVLQIDESVGASISGLTISDGNAAFGAGIFSMNFTKLKLDKVVLRDNAATTSGGAVYKELGGSFSVTNSMVSNNSARAFGGGIMDECADSDLTDSVVNDNSSGDTGGGIFCNLTTSINLTRVLISDNSAVNTGGGIFVNNIATLNATDSTFKGNSAPIGGGIRNNGGFAVNKSTISDNTANSSGGGIANFGTGELTNVTIAMNTVVAGNGGGIANRGGAVLDVSNITVSFNSATNGGGLFVESGSFNSRNSIFGRNAVGIGQSSPDFLGELDSLGFNLIENTGGATISGMSVGNLLGKDPQLVDLENYGGTTETIALRPTSPAIDAADPDNFPAVDQRGIARSQDGDLNGTSLPDIGAYERRVTTFIVTKTFDTNDGSCNSDCSLREATKGANASPDPDNAVIFGASFKTPKTILLSGGELVVRNRGTFAISGPGRSLLTISGNNLSRVIFVDTGTNLTISGVTITGGNGLGLVDNGHGGGIRVFNGASLVLINSEVTNNHASDQIVGSDGGGIAMSNGTLILTNSAVSNNSASTNAGGGISQTAGVTIIDGSTIRSNMSAGDGGGMFCISGSLIIRNSLIVGNSALDGAGLNTILSSVKIENSTITNNVGSPTTGEGGGIFKIHGDVGLKNVTISHNSSNRGGGVFAIGDGTVTSQSSIFGHNIVTDSAPDFGGVLTSQGYNLIENTGGTTIMGNTIGNILGQDPVLDPVLRNNGGPTLTRALRINSPAVDNGSSANLSVSADQRGFARPIDFISVPNAPGGDGSDIGAFERQISDIDHSARSDFDGDGKTDVTVYGTTDGNWFSQKSGGGVLVQQWGQPGDVPVPGDYDGDGKADVAVYRPSNGVWFIVRSSNSTVQTTEWGGGTSVPVAADYDGDGKTDVAVYQSGLWYIVGSTSGVRVAEWGEGNSIPEPGDYDGDGKADVAVYEPDNGLWFIFGSTAGTQVYQWGGTSGDVAVPGDYDGDGKTDAAVFRPSNNGWYLQRSTSGTASLVFGATGDQPVPNVFVR